jgi:hypothetical protein
VKTRERLRLVAVVRTAPLGSKRILDAVTRLMDAGFVKEIDAALDTRLGVYDGSDEGTGIADTRVVRCEKDAHRGEPSNGRGLPTLEDLQRNRGEPDPWGANRPGE